MRRKRLTGDNERPEANFVAFFEAEGDRLQRFATFMCGDSDLAADVAQEALARAFAAWPRLHQNDAGAYVRRIVVNELRDKKRKDRVRRGKGSGALPASVAGGESASVERLATVQALATLSPIRRAVVVLRFYEDMTEQQIADLLDRPVGTVRSDLHRALKSLRPLLGREELIPGGSHAG